MNRYEIVYHYDGGYKKGSKIISANDVNEAREVFKASHPDYPIQSIWRYQEVSELC